MGVERVLTYTVAFGAPCALSTGLLDVPFWLFSIIICGAGMGIGGCQAGLNSLSARIYPSAIRSTGAGWALRLGRVGTVAGRSCAVCSRVRVSSASRILRGGAPGICCDRMAILSRLRCRRGRSSQRTNGGSDPPLISPLH